eukprot:8223148-Alexandrium_andersonii.AAC.1
MCIRDRGGVRVRTPPEQRVPVQCMRAQGCAPARALQRSARSVSPHVAAVCAHAVRRPPAEAVRQLSPSCRLCT